MPLFNPTGAVVLDVTLRRDREVRRWTISTQSPDGWSCRLVAESSVTVSACETNERMLAVHRAWLADIEAARADGWS